MTRFTHVKHIFFDLDNTLWDFKSSSEEAFKMLFRHFNLSLFGVPSVEAFSEIYHDYNDALWAQYREGAISKEDLRSKRFKLTLERFGIFKHGLDEAISEYYLHHAPRIVRLEPGANEVLSYLHRKYALHLITNGFAEVQNTKLIESGLGRYFRNVITSEEAGVKKPDPFIFRLAMDRSGAQPHHSLMVGDDALVDVKGARNVGMQAVFYNPNGNAGENEADVQIKSLSELKRLL